MSYVNSTIMPWCVINGCRNSTKGTKQVGKNVSYHIIPKNPQRRSAWINILNQSSKFNANLHSSYVCSEHFVSDDYECHYLKEKLLNIKVKKQLKKTAIPSVNLPRSTGKELSNTPIFVLDSQNITNETNNICNKLQFPVKVLKLDAVPTSNFENEIIDVTSIKDIERKKVVDKMIADYDEQKNIGSPLTGIINKYPNFFSPKINSDAKLGDKLKYLQAINNMETCSPPKKQKRTKSTKSNVQSLKQPIFNNTTPNRDQFIQVSAVKGGLMLHALPLETDELKNTLPRQDGIDNDKEDETEEIIIVTKDEALDEANHADLTSYKEQHKENNTEVVIVTNLKETEDTTKHIDSLSKESSSQVCNSNNKCFEQSTLDNNESQFTPLYTAKVSLSAEKGCQISVPCKDCQDKSLKINKLIREKTKTNQICIWRDSDMNTVKRMNGVLSLLLMQCVGEKNQLIGKKSSIGINLLQEVIKRVDHGWSTQDTFETLSQALSVNAYDEFARTFNA